MIRTDELLAAGQHYGVRQYFTRAMDFGFSKSPDQTMKIWGDVVLEDMVRVIRTYRPDVVINGWGGVHTATDIIRRAESSHRKRWHLPPIPEISRPNRRRPAGLENDA